MLTSRIIRAIGIACVVGVFGLFGQSEVQAGKPPRQVPVVQIEPTPMPPTVISSGTPDEFIAAPCCEHKCCRRHDRKCKHSCGTVACAPRVEYRGCPAPCSVTRLVTVTHPKSCVTMEVPVQVPGGCREKVDRDRDGDMELDYGKYEVSLRWKNGGRRLVVHYDD